MAFYENYVKLCNLAGKSPSAVAVELKLGKPSVTRWKHGAVPRDTTILKIAGYFGVSVEELTQDTKNAPTPTSESERSRQIATNLKYLRDERKLSNYRLAMDLGCSQSTVKNWISGDNTPHPKMQKTIADYFGITVDALNGDELPILPTQDIKKALTPTSESERSRQIAARISEIVSQLYPETQESCLKYFESLLALQNAAQGRDIQA